MEKAYRFSRALATTGAAAAETRDISRNHAKVAMVTGRCPSSRAKARDL